MNQTTMNNLPIPIHHCDYHYKDTNDLCKLVPALKDTAAHTHTDFYEFSLITNGSFLNIYNGETYILKKDTLIFLGCGESHAILLNEPKSAHLSFIISKDYFEALCATHYPTHPEMTETKYQARHLSPESASYINSILCKIMYTKNDRSNLFLLFIHNALFHIFLDDNDMNASHATTDIDQYIEDIITEFDAFQGLTAPIADIYSQYPICRATLISNFKKQTGKTIVEYRNDKRMECSARLLSTHNLSVTEVATQVGITSLSYFSKKFYEHFGVLPNEYPQKYHIHYIDTDK